MTMNENTPSELLFCKGTSTDGTPYWAYVVVAAERVEMFHKASLSLTFTPKNYGNVIASGQGTEPPEDVKERIAKGVRELEHTAEAS
jgi:hypothetical protein